MGIVRIVWTNELRKFVGELWATHSASEIAREIGDQFRIKCSRNCVIGIVFRLGLRNRKGAGVLPKVNQRSTRPKAKPKPRPKPGWRSKVEREKPARNLGIQCPCKVIDLERYNCRWPVGDPRDAEFHFCGAYVSVESPPLYCDAHLRTAFGSGRQ